MKKIIVLASLIIIFSAVNLYAICTTTVPGGTISGEIWTAAGSPYCVEGDLVINSLTIQAGVRVQFQGNYVFEIAGLLTAIGTEGNEIVFTGGEIHDVDWQGVFFNKSLPNSELRYCTVEDSINSGIRIVEVPEPPIIRNCHVINNSRISEGGGIRISGSGLATLEDCIFDNNKAFHTGGGQPNGGGIWVNGELTVNRCTIINNRVVTTGSTGGHKYARGGGIYSDGHLTLKNTVVQDNLIDAGGSNSNMHAEGAGIYVIGTGDIVNCIFVNNEAYAHQTGGWFTLTQYEHGGAIYTYGAATEVDATNCTIYMNIAGTSGGGVFNNEGALSITNSILWGNVSGQVEGGATVRYSDVEGGYEGEGNINLNPVFVDPPEDLHIVPPSPCIDAGDNDAPGLPVTDIDGEPRICNEIVDMGADEYCNDITDPVPDIKANGSDGPLSITPDDTLEITASLDPGSFAGESCDWWIGALTPYGNFWLSPWGWIKSDWPISRGQYPLFELPETELLNTTLPPGIYTFFFVLDDNPDGSFDMTWEDYINVIVKGEGTASVPDLDTVFRGNAKPLVE